MATATGNYVHDNSSLANFKNWAQAISNAFAALGWVQTSDTGQVNWSSIASVPSNAYVYEVWKANDAQAATQPIYVKVEYGYSSVAVRIRTTVGTGSNGTGTITGVTISSAPWQITNVDANNGATTYPCYFSGDAGEFRMFLWQSASLNIGVMFGIERSKDSTGAKTADYFSVLSTNASSGTYYQALSASVAGLGIINQSYAWPSGGPKLSSGNAGSTTASYPVFPLPPPTAQLGNPMLGFVAIMPGDTADGAIVTVSQVYGGTHTYITAKNGVFGSGTMNASGTSLCPGMRYE